MVSECGAVLTVTFTTPVSPMVLFFLFGKMTMTMTMTKTMMTTMMTMMMTMVMTTMMRMAIGD